MRDKWAKLQAAWHKAHEAEYAEHRRLMYKYGNSWQAPLGQRTRLEKLRARESKARDAIFAWLDTNSPRSWRTGVPCYWVCEELTYDDAVTTGTMSVVPPAGYGSYPGDAERFAQAVA